MNMMSMALDFPRSSLFNSYLDAQIGKYQNGIIRDCLQQEAFEKSYSRLVKIGGNSKQDTHVNDLIGKQGGSFKLRCIQAYLLANRVLDVLYGVNSKASAVFINVHDGNPKVLISVPDDFLLDDFLVETAYKAALYFQGVFKKVFNNHNLDISFVGSENLDRDLFQADGYDYCEDF